MKELNETATASAVKKEATFRRGLTVLPKDHPDIVDLINATTDKTIAWVVDKEGKLVTSFSKNMKLTYSPVFSKNSDETLVIYDNGDYTRQLHLAKLGSPYAWCSEEVDTTLAFRVDEEDLPKGSQFIKTRTWGDKVYNSYLGFPCTCKKVNNQNRYTFWFHDGEINYYGQPVPFQLFYLILGFRYE